jgi:hypothetical protein
LLGKLLGGFAINDCALPRFPCQGSLGGGAHERFLLEVVASRRSPLEAGSSLWVPVAEVPLRRFHWMRFSAKRPLCEAHPQPVCDKRAHANMAAIWQRKAFCEGSLGGGSLAKVPLEAVPLRRVPRRFPWGGSLGEDS